MKTTKLIKTTLLCIVCAMLFTMLFALPATAEDVGDNVVENPGGITTHACNLDYAKSASGIAQFCEECDHIAIAKVKVPENAVEDGLNYKRLSISYPTDWKGSEFTVNYTGSTMYAGEVIAVLRIGDTYKTTYVYEILAEETTTEAEVTSIPATEAVTTESATEIATESAAEDTLGPVPTEQATVNEMPEETTEAAAEKKGCASAVSLTGIALVAALGACACFAKKKED